MSDGKRVGTDSLGRAIYECADCSTVEGAPYTRHLDGKNRCRTCAPVHDNAQTKRSAALESLATALATCLHPHEARCTARHNNVPTDLTICELCGAATRNDGRTWTTPRFVAAVTSAVARPGGRS